LETAERQEIERVLVECGGAAAAAAERLAVPPSTFYRRLKKLGITSPSPEET
jgi:DNA-binding NtrC family response regulator